MGCLSISAHVYCLTHSNLMEEYIHFFYISDSAEFPTYVDDDYEYEKPSSKRSDHLLRFARRLNGNDDDIFAKRGGDDHFLRLAKRYGI